LPEAAVLTSQALLWIGQGKIDGNLAQISVQSLDRMIALVEAFIAMFEDVASSEGRPQPALRVAARNDERPDAQ
jgi:hypothetical protein